MLNFINIFGASTSSIGSGSSAPNNFYMGKEAVVDVAIQPDKAGRVKFQASWWPAQCDRNVSLKPGDVVRVVGIRNITLLVEPAFN